MTILRRHLELLKKTHPVARAWRSSSGPNRSINQPKIGSTHGTKRSQRGT